MQELKRYHPFVITGYIGIGVILTTLTTHLLMQILLLLITWMLLLEFPEIVLKKQITYNLVLMVITAMTNPIFQHRGIVILFHIGNVPITLEAISYGVYLGCMLSALINFMKMFSHMIHTDQIIYMMHYISPNASILCSISLQQFAGMKRQYDDVKFARELMQVQPSWLVKVKEQVNIITALMSWLIEEGVDTSISMRSRGYGKRKRSNYQRYRLERRDWRLLLAEGFLSVGLFCGALSIQFAYFPTWYQSLQLPYIVVLIICIIVYCMIPLGLKRREAHVWDAIELE